MTKRPLADASAGLTARSAAAEKGAVTVDDAALFPGRFAGGALGYDQAFTHEIRDFPVAIAAGADPSPSFGEGLGVQRVLAAVEESAAAHSRFVTVEET